MAINYFKLKGTDNFIHCSKFRACELLHPSSMSSLDDDKDTNTDLFDRKSDACWPLKMYVV